MYKINVVIVDINQISELAKLGRVQSINARRGGGYIVTMQAENVGSISVIGRIIEVEALKIDKRRGLRLSSLSVRDAEIVRRYTEDEESCADLGYAYVLTRERICQILRKVGAIDEKREKLDARNAELKQGVIAQRAARLKVRRDFLHDGIALVRSGNSIRQACAALGRPMNGDWPGLLGRECHRLGISSTHGRWRRNDDYKDRIARFMKYQAQGMTKGNALAQYHKEVGKRVGAVWLNKFMPNVKWAARPSVVDKLLDHMRQKQMPFTAGMIAEFTQQRGLKSSPYMTLIRMLEKYPNHLRKRYEGRTVFVEYVSHTGDV